MSLWHENAAPHGAVFLVVGAFESSPTLAPRAARTLPAGKPSSLLNQGQRGPTWARRGQRKSSPARARLLSNPVALFLHDESTHTGTIFTCAELDQQESVCGGVLGLERLLPKLCKTWAALKCLAPERFKISAGRCIPPSLVQLSQEGHLLLLHPRHGLGTVQRFEI